jgi:enoyl-CoA hydratase
MSNETAAANEAASVTLERDGGVALLTIDDPARRNALGEDALALVSAHCDTIDADPAIGALVVRGAGGHFCSGAVRGLLAGAGADPLRDDNYALLGSIYEAVARVGAVRVPVVAAVRGAAVGAGLNLALAADVRVVARDAKLVSGFLAIGMHPGGGSLHLLMRAAGREAAAAVTLLGEPLSGARAAEVGLAWEALPDDEVEPRALELAARVAGDPALARAMKRSLTHAASIASWPAAIDAERAAQMWTLRRQHSDKRSNA